MKGLPQLLGLKKPTYNTSGEKVSFRDNVSWIRFDRFGQYQYRESLYDSVPWKTVKLLSSENGQQTMERSHWWNQQYVSQSKTRNGLTYKSNFLTYQSSAHQGFYRNLTTTNEQSGRDDEDVQTNDGISTTGLDDPQSVSESADSRMESGGNRSSLMHNSSSIAARLKSQAHLNEVSISTYFQ